MTTTYATIRQFSKMLENLDRWLTSAEAYAKTKSFDPNVLLVARLAPDQYALTRQVQAACDSAKFAAARLSGKTPPAHPDTEQTIEQLHARVRAVVEYLQSFGAGDFEDAETREVSLSFAPGKAMKGSDYITEMAQPNFFFHLCMTYAILRHNGVGLGKMDFIGGITMHDTAQKSA